MVIGLEEPILVKGVGEIIAKVDSGNGGYNVIHGEDLTVQGNILTFKTFNKDGNERRVSKKIKETLNVNIGGGHIQERPVVELDVQFGGQDYKKVLFSVTDRSGNDNKVLISKDFVGKELDALIDVNKTKISNDGVEVKYMTEGAGGAIGAAAKNVGNSVGNAAKATGNAIKNSPKTVANAVRGAVTSPLKTLKKVGGGLQKAADWSSKLKGEILGDGPGFDYKVLEDIGDIEKYLKLDAEAIKAEIEKNPKKFSSLGVIANKKHIEVYKILDWMGGCNEEGKYVDEGKHKEDKENVELAKKAAQEGDNKKDNNAAKPDETAEDEEFISEAAQGQTGQGANPSTPPAAGGASASGAAAGGASGTDQTGNQQGDSSQPNSQNAAQDDTNKAATEEKLASWSDNIYERRCAILYYACFKTNSDGSQNETGPSVMGNAQQSIMPEGQKILSSNKWAPESFGQMVDVLVPNMSPKTRGVFALRIGPDSSRTTTLYAEDKRLVRGSSGEKQEKIEEFKETYKKLSNDFNKIKSKMPKDIISKLGNEVDILSERSINLLKYIIKLNQLQGSYNQLGGSGLISMENLEALKNKEQQ